MEEICPLDVTHPKFFSGVSTNCSSEAAALAGSIKAHVCAAWGCKYK